MCVFFTHVQKCVTVSQLTGEWKVLPADVSSLPAVCTWSSPIVSPGLEKKSVIVTVNNIVPPPPPFIFTWQSLCGFRSSPCMKIYCFIYHLGTHLNQLPLCSARNKGWFSRCISLRKAGGQRSCHINKKLTSVHVCKYYSYANTKINT